MDSTTVEPARFDMNCWAGGGIIRSSVATRYQLGFDFQEGSVTLPALPDPSTLMRDLPIGTTPESREEPPVPVHHPE